MSTIQALTGKKEVMREALKKRGKYDKVSGDLFAAHGYRISPNTLNKIANKTIQNPSYITVGLLLDYLGLDK